MKRYDLVAARNERGTIEVETPTGAWVHFDDAAAEIHKLNNDLTATTIERDNAIRDAKEHYGKLVELREGIKALEATWQRLLEKGL